MNRSRRLAMVLTGAAVLLAAGSTLAWRSAAAPAAQGPPPAGLTRPNNPAAAPVPDAPVPGGPAFQMVSAFQFSPRWMGTTWDYQGLDLYNPGPDWSYFDAMFSLPNNVLITGLVAYFYDNSASDLTVWLYRGDPATGHWTFMADVTTSGALDQYRSASDTSIDLGAVDQQSYSYLITVALPAGGSSLRLIAVRIDYACGVVSLPLVLRNH